MISIMFSFKKNRKIKIVKRSFACEMQKKKSKLIDFVFVFNRVLQFIVELPADCLPIV
ncbi:Uncharacterized protein APZ42_029198 [Daphnia magna]|uniref:Uncharacterized protein n=1 Tax=Daphnia magna TaxID=35525 RepID=A0A164PUT7_9CRUS|nr:Uncharacterized protein APZ42_029198 [Daphnia magna]